MKSIPVIKFYKKKYGEELLVDVIDIPYMKRGIENKPIHRYPYYCIILVTKGGEEIAINNSACQVQAGTLITSIPGEIWSWQKDTQLNGYVLVFEEEFLLSFFNDRLFLQKFPYLQPDRASPFLKLQDELFERVCNLLAQMKSEINNHDKKDQHVLRAILYETLMQLNRAKNVGNTNPSANDIAYNRYVEPFIRMVDAEFMVCHDIQHYADKLCITTNYLNRIVHQSLGVSTKQYVTGRVIREAKHLLNYTTLSVTEIAEKLHFDTSSYFIRYFRKHTGITPKQYRKKISSEK